MARKSEHPDIKLFDYIAGRVDAEQAHSIEEHLKACNACASLAAAVRAIRDTAAEARTLAPPDRHPEVNELAGFFYNRSRRAVDRAVAGHVALCPSCTQEIARYAAGEMAASRQQAPATVVGSAVPDRAWEMIHEWEESSFAKLKPAADVLTPELLDRLPRILEERGARPDRTRAVSEPGRAERVPVLVINRSGQVSAVEYFEESIDASGARVLRHAEGSTRLDNRLVHVLFGVGENEPTVGTELITAGTLRFEQAERFEGLGRPGYFIIED